MDGITDIFPNAPELTNDMIAEIDKACGIKYIFYRNRKNYYDCYCTHCRKNYSANITDFKDAYPTHNGDVVCPLCGVTAVAKSAGISRRKIGDTRLIIKWVVSEDGGSVWAFCGALINSYDIDVALEDMELRQYGRASWYTDYVVELVKGENVKIAEYLDGSHARLSPKIYEPYVYLNKTNGCYPRVKSYYETALESDKEALSRSWLKYILPPTLRINGSGENGYYGVKTIVYLDFAIRHPAVEMIAKCGGGKIIEEIVDYNSSYKSVLNVDGKNPSEIFRCDPNTAAALRKMMAAGTLTLVMLYARRRLERIYHKPMLDGVELLTQHGDLYGYKDNLQPILKDTGLTVAQYYNYIDKQAADPCGGGKAWEVKRDYGDYIAQCRQLGYDLKDGAISRPRNLHNAHMRATLIINAQAEEAKREQIEEERKAMRKLTQKNKRMYEYHADGWVIVVPTCTQDIVDEGKAMRHCVGGYAKRHMDGKLTILFLRRENEPDLPLYTIEMHGTEMIQIRGHSNGKPTSAAMEFVKKWLEWVALPAKAKHPKKAEKSA
ncbi:MAG: PcfJ domain-containing protein [Oscillospiraceae bacterium]|nr:PcfJ domain-containing protein [Oscillospiraceae bacterium]